MNEKIWGVREICKLEAIKNKANWMEIKNDATHKGEN